MFDYVFVVALAVSVLARAGGAAPTYLDCRRCSGIALAVAGSVVEGDPGWGTVPISPCLHTAAALPSMPPRRPAADDDDYQ